MGIYGAMISAVSGLRAQSYALQNISGNIANSRTPGFKRVETSFVDMVPELAHRREISGSVAAFSRMTNTAKGEPIESDLSTHMALNGEGFFVVQERVGTVNNRPVFGGIDRYTRRGDFKPDKDGYLKNEANYYLRGHSIDPATGLMNPTADAIRISGTPVPARRTTELAYQATLPRYPATKAYNPDTPGSEIFGDPPATIPDPRVLSGTAATPPAVQANDSVRFMENSVPGGEITVYDELGTPLSLQIRWAKVEQSGNTHTWNMFYLEDAAATGSNAMWRNLGSAITFTDSRMTSDPEFTINNLKINGVTVGNVKVAFGENGLQQYTVQGGLVQATKQQQDGYGVGVLEDVHVGLDGTVMGSYTNGRVVPVARIPVVQFNADNALRRLDGGVYEQTAESGAPIYGLNGSSLLGGYLEQSNTDIADEFSKMIVTQQAYSANTRVVSTAQQMMSEIVNMVR